jgi:regulator of protease activity HflC (stomatin/prohibitin superfamily)
MQAYSRDQQVADLQLSITWHVPDNEIENVYANYGSLTGVARRTIWRKAPSAVKTVFGQYDAVSSIQQRAKLNQDISDAVTKSIDGPVVVDAVQIENIDFSTAYENAVEARMTAQVEVQKREQELAQEKVKAQIAVTQAEGRAKSVKAEADAAAYRTRIEGEAAADAIKARAAALAQNAELVELTKAERWNGQLPSTMIPGTTVPFMDMAKQ